jgi:hypothetical protein
MKICKRLIGRKITKNLYERGAINNVERIAFNSYLYFYYKGLGELEMINSFVRKGEKSLRKSYSKRTDKEIAYSYLAADFNFRAMIKRRGYDWIVPLIEKRIS